MVGDGSLSPGTPSVVSGASGKPVGSGVGVAVDSSGACSADALEGQSGSRCARSAARIRSASSASSAVMPPRTRLRAAGVRSVTAMPLVRSTSKKSKPTMETSRPRKTATCSSSPLPSTPTNQCPSAHTYIPTAPATSTTRAATATRRSRSGRRRAEEPPPVGGVGGGGAGGCGSASAARPAAERLSTWR
ncbi:hypothetical protein [Blastococcus brunescens]|uniref:Uncharacterized protein n=1 Tax=Blastococcus brunescens TaxID=1564165 RepID=A0ABZ1AZ45_9ACTN|nr:hypothetical protein [Blastococcus sp. BMG 8361]WRL63836.1 hypothetical protein U6N30_30150 [Blastococcus sp. BMG 8361]